MEYRDCGCEGLKLSALGLGCWSFGGGGYWGTQDQKDSEAVVRRAADLGITYYDTAEVYNDGRSEEALGKIIKGLPREKLVIGSKVSPHNCYPGTLTEHCEASLARLGTEYIDLYMVHWPLHSHALRHYTDDDAVINNPPDTGQAFDELQRLKSQGKIRHIGVSNFGVSKLKEVCEKGAVIAADQMAYSLISRAIEDSILEYAQDSRIGIISYMTLWQGLLCGKYRTMDDIPAIRKRTRHFSHTSSDLSRHGENGAEPELEQALQDITGIAKELGRNMTDLAVQWVLTEPVISCALVGARNPGQLEMNVKAAEQALPEDARKALDLATDPIKKKLGPSPDYFENSALDRTA